ncbi:MAG: 50S ribosomal protein L4 [Firmicutes bacterium]|nr:50S ribosomal protein L4 [Bacillota bacterium]
MPKAAVYATDGSKVAEVELNEGVFGAGSNVPLVHQAVVMQLANRRVGSADTKTRSEVSGGGRKPWRQKGTGRARHGSRRSPLWPGGGIVFGPTPRDYSYSIPKSARRQALRSVLSAKFESGDVLVVEDLKLQEAKTKALMTILDTIGALPTALVVMCGRSREIELSARNLPGVKVIAADNLNVYDVLSHDRIVFTRDSVARAEEVLAP